MSPFGTLDDSTVLGYLKGGTSLDSDVVRDRCMTFVSGARTFRMFLLIPLIGGVGLIVIGIPLSLLVIGIPFLLFGILVGGGAWWARRRLARNIKVVQAVYERFAATLPAATGRS